MDRTAELLEDIKKSVDKNAIKIELLVTTQDFLSKNYERLLSSYNNFLNSLTKDKQEEALQKYKKRKLIIELILGIISVVNLWVGQYLPLLFGGGS
jgi:hypothetical protein